MAQEITELKKQVEAALIDDPRTRDSAIDVIDNNGIVTLIGRVSSLNARQAAEELVSQHEGVVEVINQLEYESQKGSGPSETPSIPPPRMPSA